MIEACLYLLIFIFLSFFLEWIYRKSVARVQKRYGPLHVGPSGILQPFFDFLKLMIKEDVTDGGLIVELAPILLVSISLFLLYLLPIGNFSINFWGDLVVILFLFNIFTLVQWLFSATGRFAKVGSMRLGFQFVSLELPIIFSLAAYALYYNTLTLEEIKGLSLVLFPSFVSFFISSIAKIRKLPFDIPYAKQEIVAGINTELSGKKLALYKLSENLEFLFVCGFVSVLAFGEMEIFDFVVRSLIFAILFSFISSIFPRWRIDQAVRFFWTFVIPLSVMGLIICLI